MAEMYIRFVCNQPHPTADAELGMFAARDQFDFSGVRGSLQRAHDETFYWFKKGGGAGLTYPRLTGRVRTSNIRKSLFWFKEGARFYNREAGSVVFRARELGKVLTESGLEIREIKQKDPGKILWDDRVQVLAFPGTIKIAKAF